MPTTSSSPPSRLRGLALAAALLFAAPWGCDTPAPEPPAEATPTAPVEALPAPPDEPPAAPVAADGPRVANPNTDRLAASHILVAYVGAVGAPARVHRGRDEARAQAEDIRARVLAGESFDALARELSDDGTASRGGQLGGFAHGTMVEAFEAATAKLAVGEISPVIETEFGFHVIRRDPLVEVRAGHLVVSWAGAERAPVGVTRTRDEARTAIEAARAALDAGESWEKVVDTWSDGPLKEDGGDLGWLTRRQLAPQLDRAVFDLAVGETSPILETPRGFHLVRRLE